MLGLEACLRPLGETKIGGLGLGIGLVTRGFGIDLGLVMRGLGHVHLASLSRPRPKISTLNIYIKPCVNDCLQSYLLASQYILCNRQANITIYTYFVVEIYWVVADSD